ncbi:hypothetical protein DdX_17861 [Ditylenchus destructor]|uniref:Peptidase S1 domain-containing protein n=1 Tax=Ditylenchus destructor TaxID=166010 RepID=A0AAD4MM85_9BILA|nr:hypothetical protein DdX_17861 [Ditylenchus destructor]
MATFLQLLLIFTLPECGFSGEGVIDNVPNDFRVYQGDVVNIEYQYVVRLHMTWCCPLRPQRPYFHHCTGFLISNEFILTSGHCLHAPKEELKYCYPADKFATLPNW